MHNNNIFCLPILVRRIVTQRLSLNIRGMLGYGARLAMVVNINPGANVHLTQPTRLWLACSRME
ncbi:MAG: hypothetical protein BMS9Abin36_2172 [Gammaproteobacteria bacterium]|nr:MAG: hypothetical protein BMS9Abin36_2172 [Gammaproteobacteria bacterium]